MQGLYLALRDKIIDGSYPPGLRMSQEQLAADFAVSRTPLREALQRLEADGLVVAHTNRGMHVAPLVNSETEQSYALRVLVEPPTMAAVSSRLDADEIAQMREHLEEMRLSKTHGRRFQDAHQRFHEVGLQHYPDNFRDLIDRLHMRIYRHQSVYLAHPHTPDDFIALDTDLIETIEAGDPARVRRIMEFHLIDAALGLVLDADADHRFESLLVALAGRQIAIEHHEDGRIDRPAPIRWLSREEPHPPPRVTENLMLLPPS